MSGKRSGGGTDGIGTLMFEREGGLLMDSNTCTC